MQALNYLRQAREYLLNNIKHARKSPLTKHQAADIEKIELLLDRATKAPKFILPDGGRIFNDRLKGLPEEWRLPYPSIVIEYTALKEVRGLADELFENVMQCPKRIVYAEEVDNVIVIISVMEAVIEGAKLWTVQDWCALISKNEVADRKASLLRLGDIGRRIFESTGDPIQNKFALRFAPMFSVSLLGEEREARAYIDMMDEVFAVLELVEALSCANVTHKRLPAKPWKNVGKKKALQFDEYHVLTVTNGSKGGDGGSRPHGSPREHLRRGHIRRLADGRKLWINSCIVNAGVGGRVFKEYGILSHHG